MALPVLLAITAFAADPGCDTSSERLATLVQEVANLREDSAWARGRNEWNWKGRERISTVTDDSTCERAAAALLHDGYQGARAKVAVVRIGTGYVAQPGDDTDLWIILDRHFRVLARLIAPS
jgi:hypothetical protein